MHYLDMKGPRGLRKPALARRGGSVRAGTGGWGRVGSFVNGELTLMTPEAWPGPAVTEATVLGLPAAWRAATFIAQAVASCMPMQQYDGAGERMDVADPIVERPWPMLSTFDYYVMAAITALLHGNFIALLTDWTEAGWPRQAVPVHPNEVLYTEYNGAPIYGFQGEAFGADEVLHVRGPLVAGGLWGLGVIETHRTALQHALDVDTYGASIYRSGGVPSAIITVDRAEVDEKQAEAIQLRWIERNMGAMRKPAVVPRILTVQPLAFTPEDAQFLQAKQFTVAEIAFMFGMDPTDLNAAIGGASVTYANIEQRSVERVTHTIGPWLRRFEQAWSDLVPGRKACRVNVENLLRTDTLTRMQAVDIGLANGTLTLNDARRIEHLPTFPAWADVPFARPPGQTKPEPVIAELGTGDDTTGEGAPAAAEVE